MIRRITTVSFFILSPLAGQIASLPSPHNNTAAVISPEVLYKKLTTRDLFVKFVLYNSSILLDSNRIFWCTEAIYVHRIFACRFHLIIKKSYVDEILLKIVMHQWLNSPLSMPENSNRQFDKYIKQQQNFKTSNWDQFSKKQLFYIITCQDFSHQY